MVASNDDRPVDRRSAAWPVDRRTAVLVVTLGAAHLRGEAARAYDSVPALDTGFAEAEALRKKREEQQRKNSAEIKPYLVAIADARDASGFSSAADGLSLWLIGKGKLPEGIDAPGVRDAINDSYEALPRKAYRCEKTRDNDGVCF